jgi:peptidoglycan/LPS O-acetylase OafA/YrhL
VIGYHARWPGFGAGLVGVDIFFVISGFVIAGLLLREYDARGSVDWSAFYARRIRRLLPAAALMIAVVVGVSTLLAPAWSSPWTVPISAAAALTSTANFHYWWVWRDGLSPGALGVAEPTPLLHTWTLAVEEQFYLFLPLVGLAILWSARGLIARRRTTPRRALLVGTVVIGAASYALAWGTTGDIAPATAYLLPFRVFEFCFGIAIALLGKQVQSLLVRTLVGLAGVVVLTVVLAAPDRLGGYLGTMVLLPCVFAVAMILARPRVLALAPLVYLGVLSYGWYLWHLPAMELAAAWNLGPISSTATTLLAVGSLVPAVLSHHLLEQPVRVRRDPARATLAVAGVGVLVMTAVGATVTASASSRPDDFLRPPESCRLHPADRVPRTGARCEVTPFDAARPSLVLRGDSQAWQLLPAVLDRAIEQDVNVVAWIYPSCPPLELSDERAWKFLSVYGQGTPGWNRWADCLVVNQMASLDIAALADLGEVATIAAAQWSTYRVTTDPRELAMLDRGTRGLVGREPLALVVPVPELPRSGSSCLSRLWRITVCDLDRTAADDSLAESADWLGGIAGDEAALVDLTPELCDETVCRAGNYIDSTHLDAQRVERMSPYFEDVFSTLGQ